MHDVPIVEVVWRGPPQDTSGTVLESRGCSWDGGFGFSRQERRRIHLRLRELHQQTHSHMRIADARNHRDLFADARRCVWATAAKGAGSHLVTIEAAMRNSFEASNNWY